MQSKFAISGSCPDRSIMSKHQPCRISSGICESLTFGFGRLDDFGYWEHPCGECARAFEKKRPDLGPCWPFKKASPCGCENTKCSHHNECSNPVGEKRLPGVGSVCDVVKGKEVLRSGPCTAHKGRGETECSCLIGK